MAMSYKRAIHTRSVIISKVSADVEGLGVGAKREVAVALVGFQPFDPVKIEETSAKIVVIRDAEASAGRIPNSERLSDVIINLERLRQISAGESETVRLAKIAMRGTWDATKWTARHAWAYTKRATKWTAKRAWYSRNDLNEHLIKKADEKKSIAVSYKLKHESNNFTAGNKADARGNKEFRIGARKAIWRYRAAAALTRTHFVSDVDANLNEKKAHLENARDLNEAVLTSITTQNQHRETRGKKLRSSHKDEIERAEKAKKKITDKIEKIQRRLDARGRRAADKAERDRLKALGRI